MPTSGWPKLGGTSGGGRRPVHRRQPGRRQPHHPDRPRALAHGGPRQGAATGGHLTGRGLGLGGSANQMQLEWRASPIGGFQRSVCRGVLGGIGRGPLGSASVAVAGREAVGVIRADTLGGTCRRGLRRSPPRLLYRLALSRRRSCTTAAAIRLAVLTHATSIMRLLHRAEPNLQRPDYPSNGRRGSAYVSLPVDAAYPVGIRTGRQIDKVAPTY